MEQRNLNELADDKLLSLIKDGNQLAFSYLYNRHWKGLFAYAYNILNDKSLAEDVLQEVFTYFWVNRQSLEVCNVVNYLFISVRNRSISSIRKSKFTKLDEAIIAKLISKPEADKSMDTHFLDKTIESATRSLPQRCKAIFYMSRYEGFSNSEIASHFNISNRTVENQLSIALKHVRRALDKTALIIFFFLYNLLG